MTDLIWLPIDNTMMPLDGKSTFAWVKFEGGAEIICEIDGDSDPQWWREQGAVSWTHPTQTEKDDFFEKDYVSP